MGYLFNLFNGWGDRCLDPANPLTATNTVLRQCRQCQFNLGLHLCTSKHKEHKETDYSLWAKHPPKSTMYTTSILQIFGDFGGRFRVEPGKCSSLVPDWDQERLVLYLDPDPHDRSSCRGRVLVHGRTVVVSPWGGPLARLWVSRRWSCLVRILRLRYYSSYSYTHFVFVSIAKSLACTHTSINKVAFLILREDRDPMTRHFTMQVKFIMFLILFCCLV